MLLMALPSTRRGVYAKPAMLPRRFLLLAGVFMQGRRCLRPLLLLLVGGGVRYKYFSKFFPRWSLGE